MKIILANPRGFCAGVNMAIDSLEKALELFGTPLYVYHEIVHNRPVVERFRKLGVVFVDHINQIPEGATVLYSAHGVAPAIRAASASRRLRAIDATCPLVTKVHLEALRFAKENYHIVLIGHEGHDEVLGTMGEAPAHIVLVENVEEVERLHFPPGASGSKGGPDYAGLHHFGFIVDDENATAEDIKKHGGEFFMKLPQYPGVDAENKFKDVNGIVFDVTEHGWGS